MAANARGRATRQRLLDAATACFGESGYAGVRVSDVTDRAQVSHGAFYRHFRDKGDLLLEALRDPLDELLRALGAPADGSLAPEGVEELTTSFFTVYARHRQVLRLPRELTAAHDPALTAVWVDVRHRFVERVGAWVSRAVLSDRAGFDRALLAEALASVLDQLAYTRLGLATGPVTEADIAALAAVAAHVWNAGLGLS